jgi:hypothetical protein
VFGMTLADYAALKTRSDAGKPRKRKRWGRSRTPVERELIQVDPPRAQDPQGPKGASGQHSGAVLFIVSGYTAGEADPEPRSPITLQGPVGALSLTLLVTGWVD